MFDSLINAMPDEEVSELDIILAEEAMDKSFADVELQMSVEQQLEELKTIRNIIAEAKPEDDSLLKFTKASLSNLGITCEDNASTVAAIDDVIAKVEVSEESGNLARMIVAGVIVALNAYALYKLMSNTGAYVNKIVNRLSKKEVGFANKKKYESPMEIVGVNDFKKCMTGCTKAFDILKTDSLKNSVGTDTYKKISSALISAGLKFDEEGKLLDSSPALKALKEQTAEDGKWHTSNLRESLNILAEAAKALGEYTDVAKNTRRQKAKLNEQKASTEDKQEAKEKVAKEKASAKKIKAMMNDTLKVVKSYTKAYVKVHNIFQQ